MNSNNDPSIEEVLREKDSEKQKQKYNDYVSNITPKSNRFLNCAKAFLVGGAICVVGEGFNSLYQYLGNDKELAGLYTTLSLILLSIILTGLNIYQKLGQFGGAGSIVPITGDRVSGRGTGLWYRLQDLYDRGTGDIVWDILQLGGRGDLLAGEHYVTGYCRRLWKFFLCF